MEDYRENIPLTKEEVERIKDIFAIVPFDKLKINEYFHRPHLSDYSVVGRHGVSIEEVKQLYGKPHLITRGFKREGKKGYNYTMCYYKTESSFIKVIYLFDNKPVEVLNAMKIDRNLERSVKRKYGIRF